MKPVLKKRSGRTTTQQLVTFLTFVEKTSDFKKHAKVKNIKWDELARILNSLRGPSKTPNGWKLSLLHWKNQIKFRTRKLQSEQIVTDDHSSNISLSPIEIRALALFNDSAEYNRPLSVAKSDVSDPLVESLDVPRSPSPTIKIEPNLDIQDASSTEHLVTCEQTQTVPDSLEMTYKRPRFDESRDEFDRRISEERLEIDRMNCDAVNKIADAVSKIADAVLIFAQAYAKK